MEGVGVQPIELAVCLHGFVTGADGPTELRQLVKEIQSPEELVVLAVGWLAREEKINIDCRSHRHLISLR